MKKLIFLIFLIATSYLLPQDSVLGYYECWLDMYWIGHTRLYLHLDSDSNYSFGFWDDTKREKTSGRWHKENDTLFFQPSIIPPRINIDYLYDRENTVSFNEFIVVGINDSSIGEVDFKLYAHSKSYQYSTSNGYLKYDIQNCDSIQFSVSEESFTVYPNKTNIPSWIKVFVDTENINLLDRFIPNRKLYIKRNSLILPLEKELHFKKVDSIDWLD